MKRPRPLILKIPALIEFLLFYLKEVVISNVRVAYDVLTPTHHMTPAILKLPAPGLSDRQLLWLANLISMTPGTLTLEVCEDRSGLLIHCMYVDSPETWVQDLERGYVRRVRDVL